MWQGPQQEIKQTTKSTGRYNKVSRTGWRRGEAHWGPEPLLPTVPPDPSKVSRVGLTSPRKTQPPLAAVEGLQGPEHSEVLPCAQGRPVGAESPGRLSQNE